MHTHSMTYYRLAIACCSVIWHSLHKIDCYEMIFQISFAQKKRESSAYRRNKTSTWLHCKLNIQSAVMFGRKQPVQIITSLQIFPPRNAGSAAASAPPRRRLAASSSSSSGRGGADLSKGEHFEVCAS